MIVTASTESMYSLEDSLNDKASLYEMMIFVILLILAVLSVHFNHEALWKPDRVDPACR